MDATSTFEKRLYSAMVGANLSVADLAKTTRMSTNVVSRIVGGRAEPTWDQKRKLEEAVGLSSD